MAAPVLALREVTRGYRGRLAVDGASFELESGRITCLLGPSGCGKSTLLRMIAGLEPVDAGTIAIRGDIMSASRSMVPPERRGVGLVFQDNALFPHLNVTDNVAFGLRGAPTGLRRDKARALLARLHVAHLADSWPHMLSGGEQQRVAIARALARDPSLLLLDEPFSGLDGHLRGQVRQSLMADLQSSGATVLIVTHDPAEAMMLADTLILMAEGRILQRASPEVCFRTPVSLAAARLLGDVVTLPAVVRNRQAMTPLGPVAAPNCLDGAITAYLRCGVLRIAEAGIPARVTGVRFAGSAWAVEVDIDGHRVTVSQRDDPPPTGAVVMVSCDPDAIRLDCEIESIAAPRRPI